MKKSLIAAAVLALALTSTAANAATAWVMTAIMAGSGMQTNVVIVTGFASEAICKNFGNSLRDNLVQWLGASSTVRYDCKDT